MPSRELPARPDLDQYKKQAKELLNAWKRLDVDTLRRVAAHHPRFRYTDPRYAKGSLSDAQLVIAREHGFATWPLFSAHVVSCREPTPEAAIWKAAERAIIDGDVSSLERLLLEHGTLFRTAPPPAYVARGPIPDYSPLDARTIVAREHEFDSWAEFERHRSAVRAGGPVAEFEAAAEAVIAGDLSTLARMIRENPALVHARSQRRHHATLLHYVGANGVEGFRQRTPRNAVAVAAALLDAGADVNAPADMYGGNSRPLGLIATSLHPLLAGVQDALLELLIARGAEFDPDSTLVTDALANGRLQAARYLARRGAVLDLEGAAGVGRLDLVHACFDERGSLKRPSTPKQMRDGFTWACEFGHAAVVDFLLERGMDVTARLKHHGQTGLHWAAGGGHVETVKVLLRHNAPVDAKDETWSAAPLQWALFGWQNGETPAISPRAYYEVVALLVGAGALVKPEWRADETVSGDPDMLRALGGPWAG